MKLKSLIILVILFVSLVSALNIGYDTNSTPSVNLEYPSISTSCNCNSSSGNTNQTNQTINYIYTNGTGLDIWL